MHVRLVVYGIEPIGIVIDPKVARIVTDASEEQP
jgi:hypothetical protein